jgi:hypothetical protein
MKKNRENLFDRQNQYDQDWEHNQKKEEKQIVPHQSKIVLSIGLAVLFLIGFSMIGGTFTTDYTDEGTADAVVYNRISEAAVAGETIIDGENNVGIEARDFEVTNAGPDGGEARMLIWDFNLEDLDEVAIFVDGQPVREKMILTDDAYAVSIPVPSVVTISGIKDNGGGISYAVKFPNNEMTYFNTVAVGQSNTNTVLPRP